MGFASIDSFQVREMVATEPAEDGGEQAVVKSATPTYLSGESLTFPLVAGVGSAALTLIGAAQGQKPELGTVVLVAVVCGVLVTIWGTIDARAASGNKRMPGSGVLFKQVITGLLNTVLLTSALWGTLEAAEAAFGG